MSAATLFAGLLFGAIGMGAFAFGRRQQRALPFFIGATLMIYPYFFDDVWLLYGIGAVLTVLLFFLRE